MIGIQQHGHDGDPNRHFLVEKQAQGDFPEK